MRAIALCLLVVVLPALPAAAQQNFVLKAACIGGAANTVTEVTAAADGTISRRGYRSGAIIKAWDVLGRDPARVKNWLKTVDATKVNRVRVPTTVDRNPCNVGSSRPCHIVRRKGKVDYYACRAESVLQEMLDFNQWTNEPRAPGSLEVVERWREAFLKSNVDAIVKLYAPDALFIGTDSKEVISGSAAIRKYFENLFRTQRPRDDVYTQQNNMVLSEDVALVAGNSVLPGVSEPVRVTFVIAKRGTEWLIVHFHTSAMPK